MVRCKVTLDLKREREKLFKMKKSNTSTVKEKSGEFLIIQNKYSQLVDEMNGNIRTLNDNLSNVVLESALKLGDKAP